MILFDAGQEYASKHHKLCIPGKKTEIQIGYYYLQISKIKITIHNGYHFQI